jgi:hypothetical protein
MDTTLPIRWSWSSTYFWTAGKHLLATVVTTSYGFQLLLLPHGKIIKSTLRRIQPHVDTFENRLLPHNVMMIRNYEGDKEELKE